MCTWSISPWSLTRGSFCSSIALQLSARQESVQEIKCQSASKSALTKNLSMCALTEHSYVRHISVSRCRHHCKATSHIFTANILLFMSLFLRGYLTSVNSDMFGVGSLLIVSSRHKTNVGFIAPRTTTSSYIANLFNHAHTHPFSQTLFTICLCTYFSSHSCTQCCSHRTVGVL